MSSESHEPLSNAEKRARLAGAARSHADSFDAANAAGALESSKLSDKVAVAQRSAARSEGGAYGETPTQRRKRLAVGVALGLVVVVAVVIVIMIVSSGVSVSGE